MVTEAKLRVLDQLKYGNVACKLKLLQVLVGILTYQSTI